MKTKKIYNVIQNLIDTELDKIREESEEWGLGQMDEYDEVGSVNRIEIDNIFTMDGLNVYINIHTNSNRTDFQMLRSEIQYSISSIIPNIKLFISDIIDERTFGPGIDW